MEYCEHCDRSFKTVQGLLGHLRMKHDDGNGQNSGEDDSIEDLVGLRENGAQLLRQIQEQLGRLEGKANEANKHTHGGDGNCTKCHELLHAIRQRGIEQGAHAVLNIPGVREAITLNDWANKRNGDNPSSPVIISWFDVPGVKEAISKYLYDEGEVVLRDEREVLKEEESYRQAATPGVNPWAVQPVKGNSLRRLFPATKRAVGRSVAVKRVNTNGNGQEDGLIHIIP